MHTPTAVDNAAAETEGAASHAATLVAIAVDAANAAHRATAFAEEAAIDARAAVAAVVDAARDTNRALDKTGAA